MNIIFNFFYTCFLLLHIILYSMPTALLSYYLKKNPGLKPGIRVQPAGIEPTLQESESCVLSVRLRLHKNILLNQQRL